ncbi:hypothetical protein VNO78_17634 [Psophocarpus tetragonolobus]|uniref:Uncharacterized protein n=1 Tax=Psophocarpus tetragonolobus TaxID=3891 RepID=A0AAN9XLH5_PSOTE
MKLSAKPISSPGRTDKFPPPLMRFLKSNGGSRSRRSRSSPMFVRKKNTTTIDTQEPSSPKVTCMGQVRVKRASKQPNTKSKRDIPPTRCCCWIPKPNPCSCSCRPLWPFFPRKPTNLNQDSHSNCHQQSDSAFEHQVNNVHNPFDSNSNTPPRNALLLTRCRSAPYRSSSLASRFWGSPAKDPETEFPNAPPASQLVLPEKVHHLTNEKDLQTDSAPRPTLLTRCKSEPARTGHRLYPLFSNIARFQMALSVIF